MQERSVPGRPCVSGYLSMTGKRSGTGRRFLEPDAATGSLRSTCAVRSVYPSGRGGLSLTERLPAIRGRSHDFMLKGTGAVTVCSPCGRRSGSVAFPSALVPWSSAREQRFQDP